MDPRDLQQIGPYPVVRFVAEGGMAWVFEVTDPRFEHARRACKVLKPEFSQGPELALFEGEIQLLKRIDHPNVVRIWDSGQDDATDLFYYTMTFIDGPNFAELVEERGALQWEEAGEIFLGVLAGLEQLHSLRIPHRDISGVVHRDISARNVMLAPDGRAVLMDLGIARETKESDATKYTGMIRGSPLYMSPEQSEGRRPTKASDVFSLGLVFYLCLRGQTVYNETNQVDARNAQSVRNYLGHLVVSKGEFKINLRGVPGRLREVVRTACRLEPDERYQDAREMRDALRKALRGRRGPPAWAIATGAALAAGALLWVALGPEPLVPRAVPLFWQGWVWVEETVWPDWPKVRAEVIAAQGKAQSAKLDHEAYRSAMQEADALLAQGDERFRAGSREEAERSYRSAAEAYRGVLDIQPAYAARDAARASKLKAEGAAVELEEDRRAITAAQGPLAQGDARLGEKAWSDARVLYEKASRGFDQAAFVGPASKRREAARGLLDRAPPEADVLFSRGQSDYAEARYGDSLGTFDEIVKRWGHLPPPVGPNHPPELRARTPAQEEIVASRQKKLEFSATVTDADGDEIAYRWSVDGNARPETGPRLDLGRPTKGVDVAVTVADGRGGEVGARWKVDVNDAPTLTLSPAGSVTLKPKERQKFTANATDPDGGALRTEFLLGDQRVGTERVYDFEARTPGTFTLTARVTDDHGVTAVEKRAIRVEDSGPRPGPDPAALPNELGELLRDLEKAIESCDGQRVLPVWRISPAQVTAITEYCRQYAGAEASAEPAGERAWELDAGSGWICMKFRWVFKNGGPELMPDGIYKGLLVKRPDGWQFERIQKGGCS